MSESSLAESTWLRRLRFTPLRDLVRLRITGRLDLTYQIAQSSLPPKVQTLISEVVHRTHLWKFEKIDVADELTSHFHDGLDAGETIDTLVSDFGDARQAAKLIRRSKKRNRPMVWHAWRFIFWCFVVLIGVHLTLLAVFLSGRPKPSVDYVAILNAPNDRAPASEHAWPLYREALIQMRGTDLWKQNFTVRLNVDEDYDLLDARPGDEHWQKIQPWLESQAPAIAIGRQGSNKPIFGFYLGRNHSSNDPQLGYDKIKTSPHGDDAEYVMEMALPYLTDMRSLARILISDARLAQAQHDSQRAVDDLVSVQRMADHCKAMFLVNQISATGLRSLSMREMQFQLAHQPEFFTDQQLVEYAHALATIGEAPQQLDYSAEKLCFHDIVQHTYTDDGRGDGRLSLGAKDVLLGDFFFRRQSKSVTTMGLALAGPEVMILSGSRKDVLESFDKMIDRVTATLQIPAWQLSTDQLDAPLKDLIDHAILPHDLDLLSTMAPSLGRSRTWTEKMLGQRDGTIAAIALELYRRRNGHYPQTLEELPKNLLPAIPDDRITGNPVKYRLVDGRPVVYSVGSDRDDDGGRAAKDKRGYTSPTNAADWYVPPSYFDGDWILYDARPSTAEE